MEFGSIPVNEIFKDPYTILKKEDMKILSKSWEKELTIVIDSMGRASAIAQGLSGPVTSVGKIIDSPHRLYVLKDSAGNKGKGTVLGILKIGEKKLFLLDPKNVMHEVTPTCVLDFYVHESCQRSGIGKQLFDFMLKAEGKAPGALAYDRPSPKLIGFLKKYFALDNYIRQGNHYVVFNTFFASGPSPAIRRQPSALNSFCSTNPITHQMTYDDMFDESTPLRTIVPANASFKSSFRSSSASPLPKQVSFDSSVKDNGDENNRRGRLLPRLPKQDNPFSQVRLPALTRFNSAGSRSFNNIYGTTDAPTNFFASGPHTTNGNNNAFPRPTPSSSDFKGALSAHQVPYGSRGGGHYAATQQYGRHNMISSAHPHSSSRNTRMF